MATESIGASATCLAVTEAYLDQAAERNPTTFPQALLDVIADCGTEERGGDETLSAIATALGDYHTWCALVVEPVECA